MHSNSESENLAENSSHTLFTLGIEGIKKELNQLAGAGLWWLNIDDKKDAIGFVNEMIVSQTADAKVSLIAPEYILRSDIRYRQAAGPHFVNLYSMPDKGIPLRALSRDLVCGIKPERTLFILFFPENAFSDASPSGLLADLRQLSDWAASHHCALLLINTGSYLDKMYSQLHLAHRSLSGLARLTSSHCYDIAFWSHSRGVSAGQRLNLHYQDQRWRLMHDGRDSMSDYSDENSIISHAEMLEGAPPSSANWRLYKSNQQVFRAAEFANSATVIFYFSQGNQIFEIIQYIHALRIQRGNALKIIVREKYSRLRAADVELLLNCGASLVIPHEVSLPRSLSMIKSFQGAQFKQTILPDLDAILHQMKIKEIKGFQPQKAFIDTVRELMQNTVLSTDNKGILVALRPVSGLRAEQAITLCQMKRIGDIVTVFDNSLLLFLSHCHINEMASVLPRLFPLKLSSVFIDCQVWHTDRHILTQLDNVENKSPITWQSVSSQQSKIIDAIPSVTENTPSVNESIPSENSAERHSAVPVTLLDTLQEHKQ